MAPSTDATATTTEPTNVARGWITPTVVDLFWTEISNERDGGVSPATLSSTIDSVAQGLPFPEGTNVEEVLIALLMIRDLLPGTTLLTDLL